MLNILAVRLMRQPYRHIAAVGHAFVLFDFWCGILAEVGIGKVGEKVAEEIVVDGIVVVDVFSGHQYEINRGYWDACPYKGFHH